MPKIQVVVGNLDILLSVFLVKVSIQQWPGYQVILLSTSMGLWRNFYTPTTFFNNNS